MPSVAIELDCGLPTADLFERFLDLPYPVLLDAARTDPAGRRFSYIAADPFTVVRSKGRRVWVESDGKRQVMSGNPFDVLEALLDQHRLSTLPDLPPFQGGAVGYFAYELGRHLERLPCETRDDLQLPEMRSGALLMGDRQRRVGWAYVDRIDCGCRPETMSAPRRRSNAGTGEGAGTAGLRGQPLSRTSSATNMISPI